MVRDPDAAGSWYASVLGARENSRITLPGGQVLTIELQFGDSVLAIADEFPAIGVLSPLALGGTSGALHLAVEDADTVWQRALDAGAAVFEPLHDAFWGDLRHRAVRRPVRSSLGARSAPARRAP